MVREGPRQARGIRLALWTLLASLGIVTVGSPAPAGAAGARDVSRAEAADHECHLFGLAYQHAGADTLLGELSDALYAKSLPQRESPSRDGWGFGYYLRPPQSDIARPILRKGGAPASEDDERWNAAVAEIADFAFGGPAALIGHVRKSSYGPDNGALVNPHPFVDSLAGRWWLFAHNGHMVPDTLLAWIPPEFLARHPLDYEPIHVDSEVLFRFCQYEIERLGDVREGLLSAFHRVRGYYSDFVFNICLTDGDTLWAAHTHNWMPFLYAPAADSSAWWVATAPPTEDGTPMEQHHLYWFAPDGMGSASYD